MTIQINDEFEKIVSYLKSNDYPVGGHLMVAHEPHAVNKLKDRLGIWLVVVLPSRTFEGGDDSYTGVSTTLVFVLEKDRSGQTDSKEIEQYQRLESVVDEMITYISDKQSEGCSLFDRFSPKSMAIDPEYRAFGGWNGWSLTFSF